MPLRILLIALLTLLVAWDLAHASDDEIREKKVLLVLEDFQQWVDFKYQFEDQSSNNGNQTSSSHEFQETYNGTLGFSILNSHVFASSLTFSAGLEQDLFHNPGQGSSNGNSLRYNYQFSGSGLDRSVTPFTVNSYKTTETVMSPFSPSYTSNTTGNEFHLALRNAMFPSTLSFSRKTLDNSGGGNDNSTTSNTFSYSAAHQYKDFSNTSLTLSLSDATGSAGGGQAQSSRSYSAALNNTLQWGAGKKYSLASQGQVYDSFAQNVPQRNTSLSEVFSDHLGAALDLQINLGLANSSTLGFAGQPSSVTTAESTTSTNVKTAEVLLSHHLFESLTTRLKGQYSDNSLLNGSEIRYSGTGDLAYLKKLPGNNHLVISAAGMHEVIDNKLGSSQLNTVDESHPAAHQGDIITLPVTGILTNVVSVRSIIPLVTYAPDLDYTVNLPLGQITIVRGGQIDRNGLGTDLLISYTVSIDPVLKYASNTVNLGASMTFLAGKYNVGAAYMDQWMSLIHGSNQNSLRDSSLKMVYLDGNLNPVSYRVSYTDSIVGNLDAQTLEGSGQSIRDTSFGRFSLVGNERFSWYSATATVPAYSENTTTLAVAGVRNLLSNLRLTVSTNVSDTRSDLRGARDIVSLRGSLLYLLNKMSITLDGQSSWSFSGSTATRDDTATIDLVRYF
jgi:hypothetical protein